MANKRIFYATQGIKLTPVNELGTVDSTVLVPCGIQSVGLNTNFNLEKIFQLGQLEQYDSIENNPEVEVSINKVFDGTKPLFLMTMGGDSDCSYQSLIGGANNRVNLQLNIYDDTGYGSSGVPESYVVCTGLYASNFSYTFPTEGNITEEVTLVGNNKSWIVPTGGSDDDNIFTSAVKAPATARRWKFDKNSSNFPTGEGGMKDAVLSNVTVSLDLGRESVYSLGEYEPYMRYVNFPVEITTEITSIGTVGDFLSISETQYSCTGTSSIAEKTIKLVICGNGSGNNLTVDLGTKNKLQSVNYTGGDTGGGNVEISYSFTTDNTFSMTASGTYADDASQFVPDEDPAPQALPFEVQKLNSVPFKFDS